MVWFRRDTVEHERAVESQRDSTRHVARLVLSVFILTFIAARLLALLIMTRRLPDLFLHLGGTHVHHLNYGIVLLAFSGAYLLFLPPTGRAARVIAVVYAVGLGLTFDEFGMWLHLGGGYWQRASFDAVTVVAGTLALVAFMPPIRGLRLRHLAVAVIILAMGIVFAGLLIETLGAAERDIGPALRRLQETGPQ